MLSGDGTTLVNRIACAIVLICMFLGAPAWGVGTDTAGEGDKIGDVVEGGYDGLDAQEGVGSGHYATPPECGVNALTWIKAAGLFYVGGKMIVKGIKMGRKASASPNPVTRKTIAAIATTLILGGTGIVLGIIALSLVVMCLYMFVRDPVMRNPDNPNQMRKKEDPSKFTSNYWEAKPAAYSSNIYVCGRLILPGTFYVADGSCYKNGGLGKNNDIYGGPNAYLCEEEWRNGGYVRDASADGSLVSADAKPNMASGLYNPELIDMKKVSAPVECRLLEIGKSALIHGYRVSAFKRGSMVCAKLLGLGSLPTLDTYVVGCHYAAPSPPEPMCDSSIPIRKDGTKDSYGEIKPGTGTGEIIGYDDSTCMECYVSRWCSGAKMGIPEAVISLITPVIMCLEETVDLLLHGCIMPNGRRVGFMASVVTQLGRVTYAMLVLALAFKGISVLLAVGDIKISEFMDFFYRFVFTVFLMVAYSKTNSKTGFEMVTSWAYDISRGLMSIGMTSGLYNGLCNYDPEDFIVETEEMRADGSLATVRKDFRAAQVWVTMDCFTSSFLTVQMHSIQRMSSNQVINMGVNLLLLPLLFIFSFFDILSAVAAIAFFISVLLVMFWCCALIAVSIVGFGVLEVMGYLFIGFFAFKPTKGYFDGWFAEVRSYIFLPFCLVTFIGFYIACFSMIYWRNTQFVPTTAKIGGKTYKYFAYDDTKCMDAPINPADPNSPMTYVCGCDSNALGCKIANLEVLTGSLFMGIKVSKIASYEGTIGEMATMACVGLLFVRFTAILPGLATELSGGSRSLLIMTRFIPGPMKLAGKALSALGFRSSKRKSRSNNSGGNKKSDDKKGKGSDGDSKSSDNLKGGDSKGDSKGSGSNSDSLVGRR